MGHENEQDSGDAGGNFYLEDPRFPMDAKRDTAFRIRGVDGQPQQYQTEIQLQRGNLILFPAWSSNISRKWSTDYYRNEYRRRE